jgi:hypothetical protein
MTASARKTAPHRRVPSYYEFATHRLFGTYRDQPTAGHVDMKIGVDGFSGSNQLRIDWLLVQPFARRPANPISLPLQSVEAIAAPFDSGAGKASSG